jgi:hypothetical protein
MPRRKTKIEFNIGDWIKASASVITEYEPIPGQTDSDASWDRYHQLKYRKVIKRIEQPICGQIVGGARRAIGRYWPQSGNPEDGPEQAQLSVDKLVFVYLVREGFLNKPREVLPEDITDHVPFDHHYLKNQRPKLPHLKSRQPPADDRCRKEMSEAAQQQPKQNGRFIKQPGAK